MNIFPLAPSAHQAVQAHCDVHLRPSVVACAKIISDAIHANVKHCATIVNEDGTMDYHIEGVKLMHAPKSLSPWATWAGSNQANAWWLADLAYQLEQEIRRRFGADASFEVPEGALLQTWLKKGFLRNIPKLDKFAIGFNQMPLPDNPASWVGANSAIQAYRQHYASLKGKVRMKWTNATKPVWMEEGFDFKDMNAPCPF